MVVVVAAAAAAYVLGEKNVLSLPGLEEIFPLEVSAPQSSLQSIHIAEVHFYKNKIQLRTKEP